jgi:restriction system protein
MPAFRALAIPFCWSCLLKKAAFLMIVRNAQCIATDISKTTPPMATRAIISRTMAVPDFQTLMLPLLKFAADGQQHSLAEARERLATEFSLTIEDRATLLPSGRQRVFDNRVAWAKVYLQRAGLLESPRRAVFVISGLGRQALNSNPARIDIRFLEQFPQFKEFRYGKKEQEVEDSSAATIQSEATPEEVLESGYQRIRSELATELLQRVKGASPQFFEQLVVELLLRMGYGGSRQEAGRAIGKAGDEGLDGIITEDRLGLDAIYLQAKRWEGTVGRPEIQKFVGALHGKRARKGVFITTGTFSSEAKEYVAHIDPKIALIDGEKLATLMIDFKLGVTQVASYEIHRIDSDYFVEE